MTAVAESTGSPSTVAMTSRTSPLPGRESMPRRSTVKVTSWPGRTGASMVEVNSVMRLPRPAEEPAMAACSAAADSHMPWTMTPGRPASMAARSSTWIGLRSPETVANGTRVRGAVTVTVARWLRGVSVTVGSGTVLTCAGVSPLRPRMAKRSDRVAMRLSSPSAPASASASRISARTTTTRPISVSATSSAWAVTARRVPSASSDGPAASALSASAAETSLTWCSRWTRASMPSTTGTPDSVVASATAAKIAGHAWPTRASGAVRELEPVTAPWSAAAAVVQTDSHSATPSLISGSVPPAAMAVSARIEEAASSTEMTGTVPAGPETSKRRVSSWSPPEPSRGTVSTATSSPSAARIAPVAGCDAEAESSSSNQDARAPSCRAGLACWRPAQRMTGLARTRATGDTGSSAAEAEAASSSAAASSKEPRISATGTSAAVMPATAAVPGMMQTPSAS